MKEETQRKKCPFFDFDICAAYIIRDKIQDQESFRILIRKKMVINLTKWSERFCFADFEKCEHYQIRTRKIKREISKEQKALEKAIAKAKLSPEEAKVIRVIHKLPSAGQRTKKWAANLNNRKYLELVVSANEKLDIATNPQNQKGSGK